MKKNGNVFIFCALILLSVQSFGQKFGIQGGINLATMVYEDDETAYSDEFVNLLGFNAGLTFEMGLGNLISVEAAALVDSRGFQMTEGDGTMKCNLLYADVPVLVKVGPALGPVKIFGAIGPYIGFGLTGKYAQEFDGEKETRDIKWGSDENESDIKRVDYGAKFGIGAEALGFTLGAYYSLGLANLSPATVGGAKMQNKVISISVGYKFGK